jgi:hypothetical protein
MRDAARELAKRLEPLRMVELTLERTPFRLGVLDRGHVRPRADAAVARQAAVDHEHPAAVPQMTGMLALGAVVFEQHLDTDGRLRAFGVEAEAQLPLGKLAEGDALNDRRLAERLLEKIGEGLVEGDGAILGVVDDEGLRHMGNGIVQAPVGQALRLLRLHMGRDLGTDTAIALEHSVLVLDRRSAQLEPSDPAARGFARIDEIAEGLSRLQGQEDHSAHLRRDPKIAALGKALAEHLGGRDAK